MTMQLTRFFFDQNSRNRSKFAGRSILKTCRLVFNLELSS